MNLRKYILKENIDKDIQRLVSSIENRLDVKLSLSDKDYNLRFIDSGTEAEVYEIENKDKVLRLEPYADFNKYEPLVGHDFPNVVRVYYSNYVNDVLITVMEKLEPVNVALEHTLDTLDRAHELEELVTEYDYRNFDKDEFRTWLESTRDFKLGFIDQSDFIVKLVSQVPEQLQQIRNGMFSLYNIDMDMTDLYMGNVMQDPKTKELKLIDVGR